MATHPGSTPEDSLSSPHQRNAEEFRTSTDTALRLGEISVEEGAILPGNPQILGEPDNDSSAELPGGETARTAPVAEAFPYNREARAEQFAGSFLDGTMTIVEDAWTPTKGFMVFLEVKESKYRNAVADSRVKANLFGIEGEDKGLASHTKPGAEALGTLLTEQERQEAVRKYYLDGNFKQYDRVEDFYIDDLNGIEHPEDLKEVRQAIDLAVGERSVRLLNFSGTDMSPGQVEGYKKALRWACDKSGEDVLERAYTVAILPKEHRSLLVPYKKKDGTTVMVARNGYQAPNLLAISEWQLYPPGERPVPSKEQEEYWKEQEERWASGASPDELAQGAPCRTVSGGRLDVTLAHELTHVAFSDKTIPYTNSLTRLSMTLSSEQPIIQVRRTQYKQPQKTGKNGKQSGNGYVASAREPGCRH
jgi:hypothetical protein